MTSADLPPRERASRRDIVKLMRGDIIKIIAPKTVHPFHLKTFFIDYIDAKQIRAMSADVDIIAGRVLFQLDEETGMFADAYQRHTIVAIELLSRSPEPGYARQRGFVKGTWIEIHFQEQGVSGLVVGKVFSLENGTDCIGVSIFNPADPSMSGDDEDVADVAESEEGGDAEDKSLSGHRTKRIYIDFEFKGLSDDLHIKEIRICDEPDAAKYAHLKHAMSTRPAHSDEEVDPEEVEEDEDDKDEAEGEGKREYDSNDEGAMPPLPQADEAVQSRAIRDGDLVFGDDLGEAELYVQVPENMRRHDLDVQQTSMLEELLADVPTDRRTVGALKSIHTMIERYTQLRALFSTEDARGNIARTPEYTDDYKPLAEFLMTTDHGRGAVDDIINIVNPFRDWLVPIYVQRRKIYAIEDDEMDIFEANMEPADADILSMPVQLRKEAGSYAQYYKRANKTFSDFATDIRMHTTPFTEPGNSVRSQVAFDFVATSCTDPQLREIPAYGARSVKINVFSTHMNTARYLELDRIPNRASAYMALPMPVVMLSLYKQPVAQIIDQTHANYVTGNNHCYSDLRVWNMGGAPGDDTASAAAAAAGIKTRSVLSSGAMSTKDLASNHLHFLSGREILVPNHRGGSARDANVFTNDAIRNMVPSTGDLFHNLVKPEFENRSVTLSPRIMVSALSPFLVQQQHITHTLFSDFSNFISERVNSYKDDHLSLRAIHDAFASHKYGADPIGINAMYAMVLHNQTSPSSVSAASAPAFDATVVAKYGIHEWAVRSGGTHAHPVRGRILTSSELLSKFLSVDYGRCFMNEVVLMNKTLFGIDVGGVLSKYADESDDYVKMMKTADANAKGKCKNFVLAKEYLSLDDLETDNQMQEQGVAILYDQRYDPTDYEFLTKYEQKERSMPGAEFKTYLIGELMKKPKGLSATDAALEADSITARARHVQSGDHAVVIMQKPVEQQQEPLGEDPIEDKPAYYYYRLTKPGKGTGKWVRDASIPDDVRSDDSSYFCNVHPECIQLKAHCMSLDTAAGQVNSSVLTSMSKADLITKVHQEFETQFEVSSTNFAEYMKLKEEYDEYRMTKMRMLQRVTQTAQNNRDFLLGTKEAAATAAAVAAGAESVISPHVGELNTILGDGSFARKQTRIIMFVTKYTRSNQSGDSDAEWLHCAQSGAKLLPAWLYRKAAAYIQPQSSHIDSSGGGGKSYLEVLDQICKEYGRPEGDSWVDCKTGSGMVIKRVNFSHDEGYDEEGSKITTHSVLELDKARAAITPVVQEALSHSITDKLKGPHSHKINDVVQRVLTLIGIKPDRNGLRERIIVSVIDTMETTSIIASEAAFTAHKQNIKSEAGRTMAYDGYFNNMIVNISLAHIVIALQCAIPDIRPKKTFAGCEKSFGGFPLDDGGNGCIKYISCVAASVKNQINNVWSYFKNKPATIEGSVTTLITSIMASSERIRAAIKDKRLNVIERGGGQGQGQGEYAEAGTMMIPDTLTTTKWKHFFPLLHSLDDLRSPEPLPEHLKQAYLKDLRTCRAGQRDTHEVLRFKLMEYSLHIQKCIQEIVSREGVLTLFSGETPSTENACCEELLSKSTSRSVIQYFASRNRLIGEYNTAVKCLNNIMLDVTNISRASMMCSLENTRVSDAGGTGLPSEFSEDTIYKGFVSFCRMDKNIPVLDATVLKLAGEKPVDYSATDEWPDKFRKLKSAHATGMSSYTTETFSTLLDKVNAASIVGEPGSGSRSGSRSGSGSGATVQSASTPGAALLDLLNSDAVTDHVNENVEVMSEPLRERLVELLATAAATTTTTTTVSEDEETECYVMLADENRGMWTYINSAVREQMSMAAATATGAAAVAATRATVNAIDNMMTFLKTVDRFETETANAGESKSLRFSLDKKDETTVKYAQFIKSGIRFMLSVVPGLLVSGASASGRADEIIISKHWKFSEKHENDVADIMTNQNAGLREFYENPQIRPCMTQFMTLDDDQSLCATIVRCVNAVPFIETPAISRRVIQQLYKYFFLRVVKLYAFFITNPTGKINVGIALAGPRMVGDVGSSSVGGALGLGAAVRDASRLVAPAQAENESISNSSFMSMLEQTSNAKRAMRELLTAVVGILSQNKADINKTVSDVMKRTNRLKLNEKDQMRKNLKQLSQEHRTVVNELKDLRIGVWNVGAQIAKYDKVRQDQEMDAMAELEAMNAVEGTATTAAAEYNDAVDFGPDELDSAFADASESRADVDGYSAFPAGEGDDYELDQGMRNEVGITTSC